MPDPTPHVGGVSQTPAASSTPVRVQLGAPRLFTGRTILVMNAYGLALVVPMLLVILVVSVMPLGSATFLIPVLTVAVATFFLPFGFGNTHVARLVRSFEPAVGEPGHFIVQLTGQPRLRSGVGALLEDADDIGCLSVTASGLHFRGDSVEVTLPFEQIRALRRQTLGWRGLFLYGPPVVVEIDSAPGLECVKFAERSSSLIPQSRRIARDLYRSISAAQARHAR